MNSVLGVYNRKDKVFPVGISFESILSKGLNFNDLTPCSSRQCSIFYKADKLPEVSRCIANHFFSYTTDVIVFSSNARLDNRIEIATKLGLVISSSEPVTDSDLVRFAYLKWGESCTDLLYGDWFFAAWHDNEQRLFLARDHFGMTAVYYYVDDNIFVFASNRKALLDLKLAPVKLDELYIGQVLISWTKYHGERTIHSSIYRLPPAHRLTVTPHKIHVEQYWSLENVPVLHLADRREYSEAFIEKFDEAVRVRLLSSNNSSSIEQNICTTLSGGLDSGAVTATAAQILSRDGKRIKAFTSVPLSDTKSFLRRGFGDEFSLANLTAQLAGNIDLMPLPAKDCSPIQAIRIALTIHNETGHAAGNMYWLLELLRVVRASGSRKLLIGQFGNAGVSWSGDPWSQSFAYQIKRIGLFATLKCNILRTLPPTITKPWRKYRFNQRLDINSSAINPVFAKRLSLFEQQFDDPLNHQKVTPLTQRDFLLTGRSIIGGLYAEMSETFGIQICDPTADVKVLEFVFSVPDNIFIDPATGMNRWLIRDSMSGRLPDNVRLNTKMGRQAADLVPRLRAFAADVDVALQEITAGPAADYVDVSRMWNVWQFIKSNDSPEAFDLAVLVLTRGIMAGLFVNGFYAEDYSYGLDTNDLVL